MLKLTKLLDDFKTIDDVKENIIYPQLNTQYQCDHLHYLFSKFVKNESTKNILDVGCGYGRHALMLSKLNYDIMGIDLNESAIIRAKSKIRANNNPLFKVGNIVSFKSEVLFDGAYAHNSVISYLSTKLLPSALQNISNHLKPDGIFTFDYFYPINLINQGKYLYDFAYSSTFKGIKLSTTVQNSIDIEAKIHMSNINYLLQAQDDKKSFKHEDRLHYWEPKEIREILLNSGFDRVLLIDRDTKKKISPSTNGILVIAGK